MRGVVFRGERELDLVEFPDPTPGPEEVVVQIWASGMCGTDLHKYRGPKATARSVIGGHEPAGIVAAVGREVPESWLGRKVMVHHYIGCWRCDQCRTGWPQLCRSGTRPMGDLVDGSHADLMCVPYRTLLPMPEGLSFLSAAAIGCGTGTAWGALDLLHLRGGDTIAIFGQGPVGLSATQLAAKQGARVIALDIEPHRLERALEFGADVVINPTQVSSVRDAVADVTHGRGAGKSLETSGASSAANQALEVLDVWGVACWVGVGSTVHFDLKEHAFRQITAKTSWTMSVAAMERCADFVVERGVDVDTLFTEKWGLAEFAQAYEVFDRQSSGKGVFVR
jgi:threonine dehydrogenase-like Zn-dependent dehydrogenase